MNIVQKFEKKHLEQLTANKDIPDFSAGDTVRVLVKVKEGSRERIQAYEGVCIARRGAGVAATFTVRKISSGEGVERTFPLYGPRLEKIELIRRGSVRRSKLYYMRERRGKSARIAERTTGHGIEKKAAASKKPSKAAKKEAPKAKKTEKKSAKK